MGFLEILKVLTYQMEKRRKIYSIIKELQLLTLT